MTLAALADLAEVIGAFGVVAGLIFVGVQLRQNTLQLRRAETNVTNTEASVIRQAIFSDGEFAELLLACVRQTRPLNPVEAERLNAFFWEIGFQAIQYWDRIRHGLFPPGEFERMMPSWAPYLTSPQGRAWWQVARTMYRPDFVAAMERALPAIATLGESASAAVSDPGDI